MSVIGPTAALRRWRADGARTVIERSRAALYQCYWSDAARVLGADVTAFDDGSLDISLGDRTTTVWGSYVKVDDPVSVQLALRKPSARARLDRAGIGTSDQLVCGPGQLRNAQDFLHRLGRCTVKPASSGRGLGVTCGITTSGELALAMSFALRWDSAVVVERHLTGSEYRLLILDGDVISTVRRTPPLVTGDGTSTVHDLITAENARRFADPAGQGLYPITIDLDLVFTLARSGMSLGSVPAASQRVAVKTAVNENGPMSNELVRAPAAIEQLAVEAAHAIQLRYAAVEVIAEEPSQEASRERVSSTIVEINATPGLHYHYQVSNPAFEPSVAQILLCRFLGGPPRRTIGQG